MRSMTGRVERSCNRGMDRGESTWEDRCVDRLRVSAELLGVRRFMTYETLGSRAWSVSDA
jgi:hypothetical protein